MNQLIPTISNTKTITDLRENALGVLRQLKRSGPTYIFHRSEPKAVMLSVEEYANMVELVEDYLDAQAAKELEEHPEKGGKTLEQVAKELKIPL